jgi:type I restriction enzyme, S subunit
MRISNSQLPSEWQMVSIEKIANKVTDGEHITPERSESGILLLSARNVQNGYLSLKDVDYIPEHEYQRIIKRCHPEYGDVLISCSGTIGRVCIVPQNIRFTLVRSAALIKPSDKINASFLSNVLRSNFVQNQILRALNQSAQANLFINHINSLVIPLPPLLEQCKIAEVLGVWDESIDLLEKLIGRVRSRKQGLMQQLLTGKKRFKEFEGSEWKRYHFKDIFKRITRKNTVNNSNILTISGTHGLINQRDFFNKRVAADNLDGYYLIEKGEFAYNKSYSNGYPLGAIKRLDQYDAGVLSTLYICFGLSNSLNSGDFMAHYFESGIFNKEIYGIAQEGARNHGLLNIGVNDFFELFLRIPSLPEQEKIAAVLSAADEEISTLEKQLAAYKQQKLGLMQQLLTGRIRI